MRIDGWFFGALRWVFSPEKRDASEVQWVAVLRVKAVPPGHGG